jgi:hypothetical protein
MTDDVIGMAEAAALLGMGRSTLHARWRQMALPFYRPTPTMRRWVVRRAAVLDYRAKRESAQT